MCSVDAVSSHFFLLGCSLEAQRKQRAWARGHSSKKPVWGLNLWIASIVSSVLSAYWERADAFSGSFFLSRGKITTYHHLLAMLSLSVVQQANGGLSLLSLFWPDRGICISPTYSID